jgi:hypothetical protein
MTRFLLFRLLPRRLFWFLTVFELIRLVRGRRRGSATRMQGRSGTEESDLQSASDRPVSNHS